MAGNNSIQVLRGSRDTISQSSQQLLDGQLLYNTTDNYLTVGGGADGNDVNKLPIVCREIRGYAEDTSENKISANENKTEYSIKYDPTLGKIQYTDSITNNYYDKDTGQKYFYAEYTQSNLIDASGKDSLIQRYSSDELDSTHYGNTNTGESAVVFGEANNNTANRSVLFGKLNTNTAAQGVVTGLKNTNTGANSFIAGRENLNTNELSFISGEFNQNGDTTKGSGRTSLISGGYNENYGEASIIGGRENDNYGRSSSIVGDLNINGASSSLGNRSFLSGYNNKNYGADSVVAGNSNINKGTGSFVAGISNYNQLSYSFVCGAYGTEDAVYCFKVGNGSGENNRSNIFAINKRTASSIIELNSKNLLFSGQTINLSACETININDYTTINVLNKGNKSLSLDCKELALSSTMNVVGNPPNFSSGLKANGLTIGYEEGTIASSNASSETSINISPDSLIFKLNRGSLRLGYNSDTNCYTLRTYEGKISNTIETDCSIVTSQPINCSSIYCGGKIFFTYKHNDTTLDAELDKIPTKTITKVSYIYSIKEGGIVNFGGADYEVTKECKFSENSDFFLSVKSQTNTEQQFHCSAVCGGQYVAVIVYDNTIRTFTPDGDSDGRNQVSVSTVSFKYYIDN